MRGARLTGGSFLVIASFVGMFLNYLHQAQAVVWLPVEAFGRWSEWLGLVGVFGVVGLVAQFAANYFVLSRERFFRLRVAVALVALALMVGHAALGSVLGPAVLAVETVLLGSIVAAWMGQYQARFSFSAMAFTSLVAFGVRALLPNIVDRPSENTFYLATPIAYLATLVVLAPVSPRAEGGKLAESDAEAARGDIAVKIGAAVTLGACAAAFPFLDILAVSRLASPETAGVFAQTALFTRVLYLVGSLLLQVTFPYHLRRGTSRSSERATGSVTVRRIELFAIALLAVSAPVNATVLPWIAVRLVGVDLTATKTWFALSTLNFAALLSLFRAIQIDCAERRLRPPLAGLVVVSAGLAAASALSRGDVTRYLLLALLAYGLGNVVVRFWGRRGPRQASPGARSRASSSSE